MTKHCFGFCCIAKLYHKTFSQDIMMCCISQTEQKHINCVFWVLAVHTEHMGADVLSSLHGAKTASASVCLILCLYWCLRMSLWNRRSKCIHGFHHEGQVVQKWAYRNTKNTGFVCSPSPIKVWTKIRCFILCNRNIQCISTTTDT